MTALALQRVVLRMHHDPALVAAVYADPEAALSGEELTAAERAMLVAPDPRAWGTDPARRDRVLEALRKELPASCAVAELAAGRQALMRFFQSADFHGCVRRRGVLVHAMAAWLDAEARAGRMGRVRLAAVVAIEAAAARLRRRGRPPLGPVPERLPEVLRLAPWVELLQLPAGSVALFGAPTGPGRVEPRAAEWALVERLPGAEAEVAVGVLPGALAALLDAARERQDLAELLAIIRREGVEPPEDEEVLLGLLGDGLLAP